MAGFNIRGAYDLSQYGVPDKSQQKAAKLENKSEEKKFKADPNLYAYNAQQNQLDADSFRFGEQDVRLGTYDELGMSVDAAEMLKNGQSPEEYFNPLTEYGQSNAARVDKQIAD